MKAMMLCRSVRRVAGLLPGASVLLLALASAGCGDDDRPRLRGPVDTGRPRRFEPMVAVDGQPGVVIREGYALDLMVADLPQPTALAAVGDRLLVSLNGGDTPSIQEVVGGTTRPVLAGADLAEGRLLGPLTSVRALDGWIWITHRQIGANGWRVGAISRFRFENPRGTFETVITNLPSAGDHYTADVALGPDGRIYFAQGSATNSGVVGPDNASWLADAPGFHEFPPVDIRLADNAYFTPDPTSNDPGARATTVAYRPFNSGFVREDTIVLAPTPANPVQGMVAGNAAVYSFDPDADDPTATLRLEAWGFRNPYGIGFDPFAPDRLFVSNNGSDIRSSVESGRPRVTEARPIGTDLDDLFVVKIADDRVEFFGWPDFFHDPETTLPVAVTDPDVCLSDVIALQPCRFVFSEEFRWELGVNRAFAQLELHSSANKFDFSTSERFGHVGDVFLTQTGSFPPGTGATSFTGYKVVQVNRDNGVVVDFVANRNEQPEALLDPTRLNKPIDLRFQGDRMLVVDIGAFDGGVDIPDSGKIWVVTRRAPAVIAP